MIQITQTLMKYKLEQGPSNFCVVLTTSNCIILLRNKQTNGQRDSHEYNGRGNYIVIVKH